MPDPIAILKESEWGEVCARLNIMFAWADQNLVIRDASRRLRVTVGRDLTGRTLSEAFPNLLGLEDELRRIARGQAQPWRIPGFRLSEKHLQPYDVLFMPLTESGGLLMVVRQMDIESAMERELRQQRNEMALLQEQLETQTEALQLTQARLENLERERKSLMDIIALDIQSALSIAQGYAEWLQRALADSAMSQYEQALKLITQETEHIGELVREVQAFQRVERALESMAWRPVELAKLLDAVTGMWRDIAKLREVDFEIHAKSPAPGISGDPELLCEAMDRIYNYMLFLADPPATVRVELNAWPGWALMRFTCSRIRKEQALLEHRSGHALNARQRAFQLQLARARIIAEGHGGHLSLSDETDKNAVLFWLPAESAPSDEALPAGVKKPPFQVKKRPVEETRTPSASKWITAGRESIRIDVEKGRVWLNDELIKLTDSEYRLLLYLAQHVNEVVRNEELQAHLGKDGRPISLASLRVLVWRLRQHLGGNEGAGQYLRTVRGFGYLLVS
ncbi:MAG: hypothetical protein GXP42_08990 [Chloroflexi bacterium]|nr:hypothetical protein [Chloroflexota bacterium]